MSVATGAAGGALGGAAVGTAILPGIGTAVGAVGGAILGGYAASDSGEEGAANTAWSQNIKLWNASDRERQANAGVTRDYNAFGNMVNAGPGVDDVRAGAGAQRSLADMLQAYSQQGGNMPTAGDISSSNMFANTMFGTQRIQMQQGFDDQLTNSNRQSALMGRSTNDPILQAKLAQEQTRQGAVLNSQQGAFAAQHAMQQPMQRLGFATDRANVLGGLATQAMANRQALMNAGQTIQTNERNFRLQTASRSGTGQSQAAPGGFTGALTQGLALGSAGIGMYNSMKGGFGANTFGGGGQMYGSNPGGGFSGNGSGPNMFGGPAGQYNQGGQ